MSDDIVKVETVQLGTLAVEPSAVVQRATIIATELANIINDRKLYTVISKRKFVQVEGWETLGAMLGVIPREVEGKTIRYDNGTYEATVELVRVTDGAIIGRGSAICGIDEKSWASRPEYARRSMAITRATGKAYRLAFSWIMSLAGYEPTPAEEMDGVLEGEVREAPKKVSKPTNGNRPYDPETVRAKIAERAGKYKSFQTTAAQVNLLRYGLELCFAGDEAVDDKRHTLLNYLNGDPSTMKVDGAVFKAIVEDWLNMDKDSGGDYKINPMAVKEAQAIITQALIDEGQAELSL